MIILNEEISDLGTNKKNDIEKIFQNYISDLYKVAKSRLYNEEDIYDAIQETAYKLYINYKKIKDKKKIRFWIIRVLINECNRIYREKKKELKIQEKIIQENSNEIDFTSENNLEFELLLKSLKKEDRTILTLYYGNGLTTKEISKILDKNENTVRTKIRRAKESIKQKIEGGEI